MTARKIILNTDVEVKDRLDFSMKVTARQVIREALKVEGCPFDAEVSLMITDDSRIHELNREFRNIDHETDVLSFPALEWEEPSAFSDISTDDPDAFDPDNGALILGDIVININRVHSQAREYGHSEKREFAFLVAHSILHLCGYDHMIEEEAKVMEKKQEEILTALNITRGEN